MVHPNTAIHFIFAQVVTICAKQILARDNLESKKKI